MKLTKEEIKNIDDFLKKGGIKYWDVRLEMVDHIVSDMENYSDDSANFETLFKQSLKNTSWNKNLEEINTKSWKSTNKIYRKKHLMEMLHLIKQPKSLIGFIIFYVLFNKIVIVFPEALKIVSFIVIGVPIFILFYECIKSWRKKLGRSVNMQYGFFYFSFGLIMTNLPLQLLPKVYLSIWLPIIMTLYLLMMVAGYKVYKYALNKVLKLKSVS